MEDSKLATEVHFLDRDLALLREQVLAMDARFQAVSAEVLVLTRLVKFGGGIVSAIVIAALVAILERV